MAMSQQSLPPVNNYTGSFTEDNDGDGVRLNAFGHEVADIGFDTLSANRRFSGTADLAVLGTLVFAGPTRETMSVMVPDCIVPPVSGTVRVDLRHHIGLSLGLAVDMTNWSLCPCVRRPSPTHWDSSDVHIGTNSTQSSNSGKASTTVTALTVSSSSRSIWAVIFASSTRPTCASGDVR